MKQESKQDIILRLTEGLNQQQQSVPQLPADARARKISVLGSKTDPQHPFDGYMVGADESAEPGKKNIGPDKNDPYEKGWRAGFRHNESNPYPAGSKQAAQWDRGYAEAEAQPNHYDESLAEVDFNPGRRGFLKKAGAVAATAAMPTGLAGAAAKAMAPGASIISAPFVGLTAIDLDNIVNLLDSADAKNMIPGNDPYDLDIMKSIAQDAARESWGNPWMERNAAQAFLDAVELGRKNSMSDAAIIDNLKSTATDLFADEMELLKPEDKRKVQSQSLRTPNVSEPAASPTTGMSGLARAAGAQLGRTATKLGKATATTVLNQPAKSAALPAPSVSPSMQIPKQKTRVAASPFNDDHSELDQFVKEEFNRHPDDINEESGAVVAHGYAYNRQDQRVAWTREFASEAEATEWARRRNATVLSIVPKDSIEEDWKRKLAGAALAGAAAFGGGGAQAQTTAPTGVNATGNNAAIVQSLVNPVAQQRFAAQHADTTAKLTDPKYTHNPDALAQHQAAPQQQHAEMLQNIKNIEHWQNPYRIIQMAMNMAGVTPQEVLQNLPQGYKLPTTEPKTAPVRLPGDPGYVREGAGTVGGNNPAAAWPDFGAAKTYESQLAEAKQRLAEAESRYVLYFNGKPASHYATEAEAKRIADSIKAKHPTVKIEIKNEMHEGDLTEVTGDLPFDTMLSKIVAGGNLQTLAAKIVAKIKKFPQYRMPGDDDRDEFDWPNGYPDGHFFGDDLWIDDSFDSIMEKWKSQGPDKFADENQELSFKPSMESSNDYTNYWNGVLEVLRRLESIPGATEQLAKMVWHGLFSGNVEQGITDIGKPGVSEGKSGIDKYVKLLKNHDWAYDYGDDQEAQRGYDERQVLLRLAKKLDPKFKIWNEYAPADIYKKNLSKPKDNYDRNDPDNWYDESVAEGKPQKRADRYHINKDGKPASLASYADKSSAVKDRDAKYPDAKVHQVGPRGKVKGEFEEGMAEGKWNYPPEYTKKANADDEAELGVSLINKDARKAWRKKQKARAHKDLMTGKKKEPGVAGEFEGELDSKDRFTKDTVQKMFGKLSPDAKGVAEGARVDRMVRHIASSEKATGKSNKDAENIAWATVNKRGYLDNKNKKKHVAEAGTPADIRAKNRAVVKKIQGKEVKEDITQEDIITKLKAKLGDYLSDLGQQIKKDPALQDKLSAKPPGDQVGPPVKTLTTDDGHEISIHGNEDDGFRISIKNRQTPSKFDSLDEAVMACEMYRAHRQKQALNADYVEEA